MSVQDEVNRLSIRAMLWAHENEQAISAYVSHSVAQIEGREAAPKPMPPSDDIAAIFEYALGAGISLGYMAANGLSVPEAQP